MTTFIIAVRGHRGPGDAPGGSRRLPDHRDRSVGVRANLARATAAARPSCQHAHHHNHGHHHTPQNAHELAHPDEIRHRFPSRNVTTGQIVMFRLSGGLIPCSAAIAVLVLCLQVNRIWLGVALVLSFSIGLAITLIAAGMIAAVGMRHFSRRWSGLGELAQTSAVSLQHRHDRLRALRRRLAGLDGRFPTLCLTRRSVRPILPLPPGSTAD